MKNPTVFMRGELSDERVHEIAIRLLDHALRMQGAALASCTEAQLSQVAETTGVSMQKLEKLRKEQSHMRKRFQ